MDDTGLNLDLIQAPSAPVAEMTMGELLAIKKKQMVYDAERLGTIEHHEVLNPEQVAADVFAQHQARWGATTEAKRAEAEAKAAANKATAIEVNKFLRARSTSATEQQATTVPLGAKPLSSVDDFTSKKSLAVEHLITVLTGATPEQKTRILAAMGVALQ